MIIDGLSRQFWENGLKIYAYPVAYWGSRRAFSTGHDGEPELPCTGDGSGDAMNCKEPHEFTQCHSCNCLDPYTVYASYIQKFSLAEKFWLRELDNHSTVKMSTGEYITFHDQKVFVGDGVRRFDNDDGTPPEPHWTWTEGYGWIEENK